jgi:hypothetical protein
MTAKEKATELLNKSLGANFSTPREKEVAQYWAAINTVDEILAHLEEIRTIEYHLGKSIAYWNDVKEEIEKL